MDIFENAPKVDADILHTNNKDAFSKRSGYVWTWSESYSHLSKYLNDCGVLYQQKMFAKQKMPAKDVC